MRAKRKRTAVAVTVFLAAIVLVVLFVCYVSVFFLRNTKEEIIQNHLKENQDVSGEYAPEKEEIQTEAPPAIVNPEGMTLRNRICPPYGYEREEAGVSSLTSFLREYPLKKAGKPVRLYNGEKKYNQNAHIAVFKLPLENEDLQQCADSVIRVYAEYFWSTKQWQRISFQFVDGFQADYDKWRKGYRIQSGEGGTNWMSGGTPDDSYRSFVKYLRMVFAYASTLSMEKESKKIELSKIRTGDIFLRAGSPGHVVMVVDICKTKEGKKAFLLGQGYMPAQEFHILKNPAHEDDPWYYEEEVTDPFETPEYSFEKGSLRRLRY